MKLKDLIQQLAITAAKNPETLEYDVVMSVEHTDAAELTRITTGLSDTHASSFIVDDNYLEQWLVEMGYDDIEDALSERHRKVIMLD